VILATALEAQTLGMALEMPWHGWIKSNTDSSDRDRDVKDERDDRRENGANGDDRKRTLILDGGCAAVVSFANFLSSPRQSRRSR
jgi:hypothetical protein